MKTALLASAAVFALTGGASAATPAKFTPAVPHHVVHGMAPGNVTLYDQNIADNGIGVVSDDFTSGNYDSFDAQTADDFKVPKGQTWKVKEVDVSGVYFNGSGPATGVNVFMYKNVKGVPGDTPVAECDGVVPSSDDGGTFTIKIPKTCKISLKSGKYFVSVQAQISFIGGAGEWAWETNNAQQGGPAMFRSKGGFGCTDWDVMVNCIGSYGEGPDVAFALIGTKT